MIDWSATHTAENRAAAALAEAKAQAHHILTTHISAARGAMITALPGQQMIYMAKEAEAARWIADPAPDPAAYPMLSAEIGITAPDAESLCQVWLNMGALWRQAAAQLEALRLGTAAAIDAASDRAEVQQALVTLVAVPE